MSSVMDDIRYAFRMLVKSPTFTTVAVLTLALSIGANAAIFSIVYGTLLQPMPYPHPNELVMLWSKTNGDRNMVSPGEFADWKRKSSVFQDMYAWTGTEFNLATPGAAPEVVYSLRVTPGAYRTLGERPFLGRDFLPEDGEVGKDPVVILTHKLWVRRFGADGSIVGRQIRLDGEFYTIVGVLPPGTTDRGVDDLSVPLAFKSNEIDYEHHSLFVTGRLRPGVSLAQAQADMNVVTQSIATVHPRSNENWSVSVEPMHNDFLPATTRNELWLFFGAVGFVLMIACANVANLMLARTATREREIVIRLVAGASRLRILGQFLTESLMLAIVGGAAGIGIAKAILRGILAMIPVDTLPSEADVRLNLPVLLFTLVAAILSAVLFGIGPALQASSLNLNNSLKGGGRSTLAPRSRSLRRVLVVMEFALAFCLLIGAGLGIRSFWNLTSQDRGIRTDHVVTFRLLTLPHRFGSGSQINTYFGQILSSVAAVPGVIHTAVSVNLPMRGALRVPFSVAGRPASELGSRPVVGLNVVTPGYFQTFGIRIDRGRAFNDQDVAGGAPVAVVNEAFVRHYLANADPLAQVVSVRQLDPVAMKWGPQVARQIVGVFHDVRNQGPRQTDVPEMDVPFWQAPGPIVWMAVRTSGNLSSLLKDISAAVQSVDSDLPLNQVRTMDQIVSLSLADDRWVVALYAGFGVAALLLAIIGVYGVISYSVEQQTPEIGIRMALGAEPADMLRVIVGEGLRLAGIGVVIGLGAALALTRLMSSLLFGVSPNDPETFVGVAILLVAAAVAGCLVPAQRAMRVDPMVAVRYE
jgi:predicted permease